MDKPPFDLVRAAFYLLAAVFAVQLLISLTVVVFCMYYAGDIVGGKFECDKSGKVYELLVNMSTVALSLLAGQTIGKGPKS